MTPIWQSIRQLVALQMGGLQVVTLLDGTTIIPENETAYTGKQFEIKGIRTVVQPDMDVMVMLSPEVLAVDGLWEQHTAVVEQKLSIIYKLQRWIQRSWIILMVFPVSYFIFSYVRIGFPAAWISALESLALSGILYLSRRLISRGVSWTIGRYLHAQLQKYLVLSHASNDG